MKTVQGLRHGRWWASRQVLPSEQVWSAPTPQCLTKHVQGGEKRLVVGVDDVLMDSAEKKIPRADVAELCVQALQHPEYRNRCARPCGEQAATFKVERIAGIDRPSAQHSLLASTAVRSGGRRAL